MDTSTSFMQQDVVIDLEEILFNLLRKWYIILLSSIFCALIAFGYTTFFVPLKYTSQSMLYVISKSTDISIMTDLQIGKQLTDDFIIIAKSKKVIDNAIVLLNKNYNKTFTREEIENMLSVSNEKDTRILKITTTSTNPEDACIVANAVSTATAEQMANIMKSDPPSTVEKAEVASTYSSPSFARNTLIGFLIGFVLCCSIITFITIKDDKIKTEEDVIKYLNVPVLATIPLIDDTSNGTVKNRFKNLFKL